MDRTIAAAIASRFQAMLNCQKSKNGVYEIAHSDTITELVDKHAPSGSGFDNGTRFNFDESTPKRLVFDTSFHHMTEHGYYDGWSEHKVIVTPAFQGFDMRITGRDRNQIKDLIGDSFHHFLSQETEL